MKWIKGLLLILAVMSFLPFSEWARGEPSPTPSGASVAPPPKKNKYQRSRLTNDESESIADKRRLLLTTGEDKAVDLDFDANGGANGISYGNPQILTTT